MMPGVIDEPADRELLDAVQRRAAALSCGDGEALRHLLHPGFRWTSHRGDVFDRDTYVDDNTRGQLRWTRQSLSGVVVSVVDQTGVVTSIVTDEVERDGTAQTFRMPVTQTWTRRDGHWQCLAGHAGPLLH